MSEQIFYLSLHYQGDVEDVTIKVERRPPGLCPDLDGTYIAVHGEFRETRDEDDEPASDTSLVLHRKEDFIAFVSTLIAAGIVAYSDVETEHAAVQGMLGGAAWLLNP